MSIIMDKIMHYRMDNNTYWTQIILTDAEGRDDTCQIEHFVLGYHMGGLLQLCPHLCFQQKEGFGA